MAELGYMHIRATRGSRRSQAAILGLTTYMLFIYSLIIVIHF
jgi:hypothetical protein